MRNLLLIGAQKSGSTYLHNLLAQDPKIGVHAAKEPYYFTKEKFLGTDYHSLFNITERTEVILDSSVTYLHTKGTADRVFQKLGPDVIIVAVLRDPKERAASAYLHNAKHGRDIRSAQDVFRIESTSASDIYDEESERIQEAARRGLVYLDRTSDGYLDPAFSYRYVCNSLYREQLRPYFDLFRTVIILDFDDLALEPATMADSVRTAAGLCDRIEYNRNVPRNKTKFRRLLALDRRRKFNGQFSLKAAARLLTQRYDKKFVVQVAGSSWSSSAFEQYKVLVGGAEA
jgi:hypothetical protein